jgi:predicted Zn-dependent protease
MGRRNRKSGTTATSKSPATPETSHYHAVVQTQWREVGGEQVFTTDHASIQPTARSFEVTHEPVPEAQQPMPAAVASDYPQLVELATLASDAAIARLEMLAQRHPGVTVLSNLLAAAYSRRGRMKDAVRVVEANYRQNPQYLFGRIQYAQLCLATGNVQAVPAIFDQHFDLKRLYPHRRQYHISEFAAFMAVAAEYHIATGNLSAAQGCFKTLSLMAPEHELTKRLSALLPNAG